MPVQTQLQQRRGTAASWTSTNPTLAAGEIGFETDTNKFKIGTGSAAWVSLPYASNVSPLTTKGDLYAFSTTNARLPVGANGDTIVANSSTATGLSYAGNYAAGKNAVINGAFNVWQRGTSFTNLNGFFADRFQTVQTGTPTSMTTSQQIFTPGSAPVAGYEGTFFARNLITTVGALTILDIQQRIENVRTFAGETVTLSFYAKGDSARNSIIYLQQAFGSGGSGDVFTSTPTLSITTAWTRFSFTLAMPSIAGKTIGTNSYITIGIRQAVAAGSSIDIWGVQLEAGSVATAFQTATGTIQGELAACQRYYYRNTTNLAFGNLLPFSGVATSATNSIFAFLPPVPMRATPVNIDFTGLALFDGTSAFPVSVTALSGYQNASVIGAVFTSTGLTTNRTYALISNNTTTAFIGFNSEF